MDNHDIEESIAYVILKERKTNQRIATYGRIAAIAKFGIALLGSRRGTFQPRLE
jgi:hypothetical protein